MRHTSFKPRLWIMVGFTGFSAFLQSCDDSSYTAGIDGSGGPLYAHGPIEAFGSIVVAGEHYEVSGAAIRVNGEPATEEDLAIGQIVTVHAHLAANGIRLAAAVDFEANLRGPAQLVDPATGLLIALEQEIRLGPETVVDIDSSSDIAALAIGDYIEVSGLVDANGNIDATRIVRVDDGSELRIIGHVQQVDYGSFTFSIGDLTVDYSGAGLIEGFPTGAPANGDEVLAVGNALSGAGAFVAERLSLAESDSPGGFGQEAEVEGLITRFVSPSDFDVAGKRSTTTAFTVYEGGTAASLQLNVKIQIEGRFDSSGTIVAEKIEVKDGGAVSN